MTEKTQDLKRSISLFGGVSILTGIMVGSGIFFVGSYVLARTGFSSGLSLLAWILGGIIVLMYGLIYAELGAMWPEAGGYYVYLKKAFGKPLAFMSAFMNFMLASSGSIAALAIAFSLILNSILFTLFEIALATWIQVVISILMIAGLSFINYLGIHIGAMLQKAFLIIKAIPIIFIILIGFIVGTNSVDVSLAYNGTVIEALIAIAFAVIATFWAYEGWTNLNSVAGEVKNPGRNIPYALIISIVSVTALYVLYQFSLFSVLSVGELEAMITSGNIYTGIDAAYVALGTVGMYLVMLTMLISVFGALNGSIIVFPRIYYAMSKDNIFFKSFSKVHKDYKTPYYAIIGSGVMATILLVFGLDDLISLVAFAGLFFNIFIFISLFVFRKRFPDKERPYKVWGYPVLPVIAIIVSAILLFAIVYESPLTSLYGAIIILAGLPIYYLFK